MEGRFEERSHTSPDESIGEEVDADRSHHHEREARVPCTGDIEKADDLRRPRHSGNGEPDGKERAGSEGCQMSFRLHCPPPTNTCRTTKTVAMPVAMNTP